ncbi:hypothetical protein BDZ89DRAFT_1072810 [Hymenopellis radicata]|nr:hypothetical protein BDZ89DRAFT_1072810 [Hymenopellis radicata]
MSLPRPPQIYTALSSRHTLNDSAVHALVAALTLPATRPEPSAHDGDKFNVAFSAFRHLTHHLLSLPVTAKAWTEPLMVQVVECLMAFVLYYAREIVLCGKIVDFRDTAGHDFHSYVNLVVQALLSHPFTEEGHPKSKAYGRELKMFLADIIPALLLTYDALDDESLDVPSTTASQVSLLFKLIDCLNDEDPRHLLYQNFFQILDQNPAMNGVLASAFLIATNGLSEQLTRRQHSQAVTALSDTSCAIFSAYRFITPFLPPGNDDLYHRLLQGGHTRTTCELFSAIAQEARDVVLAVADTRDKGRAFGAGILALETLGRYIKMRLESEGRVRVELALHYDVLYQMREFDRLLHELGSKNGNQDAMMSEFGSQLKFQDEFIQVVKPYLVYYDLLEMVSRRSPMWTTFAEEIESLEGDRTAFDKVYRESCQAQDCPHSYVKSPLQTALHRSPTTLSQDLQKLARANSENQFTVFRCSGCRLVYYCSEKCQQGDWKDHKSVCASVKSDRRKTGGPTNVLSRRDITFMHTIACLTLGRHPPPDGLVRDMDFRTSPPTLTLQSLHNSMYDDAKIVVGEEEIHNYVIRKRVMEYMRSLKQEVGIVYSRQFLPKGAKAVLTFVNWEMLDGKDMRYKRREV